MLHLTRGNTADITAASTLLAAAGRFRRLIADLGFRADDLRRALRAPCPAGDPRAPLP